MVTRSLRPCRPYGVGPKNGVVDINDYACKKDLDVPVAIPSKGREDMLCDQTLSMLQSYGYNMSNVHVFVDATHRREDGRNEYDVYFHALKKHGFGNVHVHPGGPRLRDQYRRIFEFFEGAEGIILTSDLVPQIDWRRRKANPNIERLPKNMLKPVIRVGFDLCRRNGARAWSLASCKAGLNLQAGHISRKCGLLCGNFCGVRLDVGAPIMMTISDYTTDVEFSLRCWNRDGAMVRFLGIAAQHRYRSRGGHRSGQDLHEQRYKDTCTAIKMLAKEFPKNIVYTGQKKNTATMSYRFLPKGPRPFKFKGTYTTRGRRPEHGWRDLSNKERQRRWRARQKKNA